jgi:hypothetical protein
VNGWCANLKIRCAPMARNTSGGRFHAESIGLVADERFGRVAGRVEAS